MAQTMPAPRDPFPDPIPPEPYTVPAGMARTQFRAMGTSISLLLPLEQAQQGTARVQALFAEWEQTLSRFLPDSELMQLNQRAGTFVTVSPLLFKVLETALTAAQATNGLYDPTLLHQIVQMGYDRTFDELPAQQAARNQPAYAGGGWRAIQLDKQHQRVLLPRGVGIDFGGIAKGMAVDAALAQLQQMGITPALVNAGGDLAVLGTPPVEHHWPIAIQGKDRSWVITLQQGSIATSGIARRHWQQGTQLRHHLIDPRTGISAQSGVWSVTVAAARCEQAEVAAKVAFLLGMEQGSNFLRRHGLAGLLIQIDGLWMPVGSWPLEQMLA